MSNQKRVPRGVFTGGRYAADERGEPDVSLGSVAPLHVVEGAVARRAEAGRALGELISRRDSLSVWQRGLRAELDAEIVSAQQRLSLARHNEEAALGLAASPEEGRRRAQDDLVVEEVLAARGTMRDAERSARAAEKALRGAFEFPPIKALAKRRAQKARQELNEAAHTLANAEQRLSASKQGQTP